MLFLTARDEVDDRVRGLETWRRRFIWWSNRSPSPNFWPGSGRCCGAAERRRSPGFLRAADLELDLLRRRQSGRQAHRPDGQRFALLELLLRRQGKDPAALTDPASQVWDMNFDSDTNVIEVAIKRLRSRSTTASAQAPDPHRARHGLCLEARPIDAVAP